MAALEGQSEQKWRNPAQNRGTKAKSGLPMNKVLSLGVWQDEILCSQHLLLPVVQYNLFVNYMYILAQSPWMCTELLCLFLFSAGYLHCSSYFLINCTCCSGAFAFLLLHYAVCHVYFYTPSIIELDRRHVAEVLSFLKEQSCCVGVSELSKNAASLQFLQHCNICMYVYIYIHTIIPEVFIYIKIA